MRGGTAMLPNTSRANGVKSFQPGKKQTSTNKRTSRLYVFLFLSLFFFFFPSVASFSFPLFPLSARKHVQEGVLRGTLSKDTSSKKRSWRQFYSLSYRGARGHDISVSPSFPRATIYIGTLAFAFTLWLMGRENGPLSSHRFSIRRSRNTCQEAKRDLFASPKVESYSGNRHLFKNVQILDDVPLILTASTIYDANIYFYYCQRII